MQRNEAVWLRESRAKGGLFLKWGGGDGELVGGWRKKTRGNSEIEDPGKRRDK